MFVVSFECAAGMTAAGVCGIHALTDRTLILEYSSLDPYNFSVFDLQSGAATSNVDLSGNLPGGFFVGVRPYDSQRVLVALQAGVGGEPETFECRFLIYDVVTGEALPFLDLEGEWLEDFAVTAQFVLVLLDSGVVRTYAREPELDALRETRVELLSNGLPRICVDDTHDVYAVFERDLGATFNRLSTSERLFSLPLADSQRQVRAIEFAEEGILVLTGDQLQLFNYQGDLTISGDLDGYASYLASGGPETYCVATFDGSITILNGGLRPIHTYTIPDDLVIVCLEPIGPGQVAVGLGEWVPVFSTFERPVGDLVQVVVMP